MSNDWLEKLAAPFPVNHIHWRVGATMGDKTKGMPLAYIDARDAMERLDQVVGADNWQRRYPWANDKKICCEVGICIPRNGVSEWVWKADGSGDTDVEAEKGAFSDSFKRACVSWGIGRYLYDLPNVWVPITPAGRSFTFSSDVIQQLSTRLGSWQEKYFAEKS